MKNDHFKMVEDHLDDLFINRENLKHSKQIVDLQVAKKEIEKDLALLVVNFVEVEKLIEVVGIKELWFPENCRLVIYKIVVN